MSQSRPIRVAVVGGGCAAMAAAFELTRPEQRGRYHVTVYQRGFRLGGKGASGRGPGDRIEEHGLHIWMGFYENAFRLIRECYAELGRDPATCPLARWDDAFVPDPITGVSDRDASGEAAPWLAQFPPGAGTPGDPQGSPTFGVADYMVRAVQLVQALLLSASARSGRATAEPELGRTPVQTPGEILDGISRLIRYGALATLTGALQATQLLQAGLRAGGNVPIGPLLELLDAVGRVTRRQLDALLEADVELRRVYEIVDLVLAILRGSLRFGLATHPDGFDAINDYDWREWLRENGASDRSLDSAFLHSLYDLAFAYEDGDKTRPRAAAGEALRCAVRAFLTYRGAFFWKMQAGMGDVVFAPLYEVLARRGVDFRFFHRLEQVRLAPPDASDEEGRTWVEALEFDVQAHTESGSPYRPLVDVGGLPCWPAEPDWSQLEDGARLRAEGWNFESYWDTRRVARRTLRVTEDFDFVVLGVGLGAVPFVAREIVERDARWARMVEEVRTIATQAFQVWLAEPVEALGWKEAPVNITGLDATFETWADMRQLIAAERFPRPPRAIAYFCSSLETPREIPARSDASYPATAQRWTRAAAIHQLNHQMKAQWPQATRNGRFRFELLVDARGRSAAAGDDDESRFDTQFWTANVDPSDRYVLCLPGSARHRISPLDDAIDNLTVAGDWTQSGLNVGCVESAVISGRLAAHALSGAPALADIPGFDHP